MRRKAQGNQIKADANHRAMRMTGDLADPVGWHAWRAGEPLRRQRMTVPIRLTCNQYASGHRLVMRYNGARTERTADEIHAD